MLALSGVFNLVDAAVNVWMMGELRVGMSLEAAERIDATALGLTVTRFGLVIVTAIAFLTWLHRSVANARALGYAMPCSPAAAVWHWFIPCYNLFWGYKIGQELWRASVRSSRDELTASTSGVVAGWWITWVGAGIIDRASSRIATLQPTVESLENQMLVGVISSGMLVVSAFLGVMMVRAITSAQEQLHHGEAARPPTTF